MSPYKLMVWKNNAFENNFMLIIFRKKNISSCFQYIKVGGRDGNGTKWGWVSLFHIYIRRKNSSTSTYPNPTGIELFSHLHLHQVTYIILYPYSYPFSYISILILINFYKTIKNYGKENIILSNIQMLGRWLFLRYQIFWNEL